MTSTIIHITPTVTKVSDKTNWTFIEVETSDGVRGVGEATLYGQEAEMGVLAREFESKLKGQPLAAIEALAEETSASTDSAQRAVISALEQASWDISGKLEGKPVHELLGGAKNTQVLIYANTNRRTVDRSLAGFEASARDAVDSGFNFLKIAPFDGLQPDIGAEGDTLFSDGIDRIAATCEAAGPDVQVLVDCHWRLTVARSEDLIRQAAEMGLYWVECPLPEDPDDCSNLAKLRPLKDSLGVRMAGTENGTNFSYFEKFIAAEVYDVIMPDVKYAGGIGALMRLAELAHDRGIAYSPHNPTGPVCHLATLHVAAVIPNLLVLEHQFDESPMFKDLCPGSVPEIIDGFSLLPMTPGIGFSL
jgi:galactonate dehydratase